MLNMTFAQPPPPSSADHSHLRLLFSGPFYQEDIVRRRGMPSRNPAAYNRILRLCRSLIASGAQVTILASSNCVRCGGDPLIDASDVRVVQGVTVYTVPALLIPCLGAIIEPVLIAINLIRILGRRSVHAIFVYNSSPNSVAVALVATLFRKPVIADIEDVSVPRLADLRPHGETNFVQQLVFWMGLKVLRLLASGMLLPTHRFAAYVGNRKPVVVSAGVHDVESTEPRFLSYSPGKRPLEILLCGKLSKEYGIELIASALDILQVEMRPGITVRLHVTGPGDRPPNLNRDRGSGVVVCDHGFLIDSAYEEILAQTDVALGLQSSQGRHSQFKTPSKIFEFLARGKLVISTDVGDLAQLDETALILLRQETPTRLAELLVEIATEPRRFDSLIATAIKESRSRRSFEAVGADIIRLVQQCTKP